MCSVLNEHCHPKADRPPNGSSESFDSIQQNNRKTQIHIRYESNQPFVTSTLDGAR